MTHALRLSGLAAAALMIAAGPAANAQLLDDGPAVTPPEGLSVSYSGSVYFLQVANVSLSARFGDADYAARASFQSAGLLRWFDDTDIVATSIGYRNAEGLAPYRYEHINYASEKGRVVGIDFPDGRAVPDINPPFGSMGEPPASDEERQGALDPISVMLGLTLAMPGDRDEPCSGRLPVFDGKARYDLRFENAGTDEVRTRAWQGEAIRCRAYVEPISGYDDGDRPDQEEQNTPVHIWLAPIDDVYVPVRFRASTRIGNINVTANRITLGAPPSE
ncbi:MAG: DUF3108 domain-containing protein [Oceanicaulis sp.]